MSLRANAVSAAISCMEHVQLLYFPHVWDCFVGLRPPRNDSGNVLSSCNDNVAYPSEFFAYFHFYVFERNYHFQNSVFARVCRRFHSVYVHAVLKFGHAERNAELRFLG